MSDTAQPAPPASGGEASSFQMIRTLAGVAIISGFLIVLTDGLTAARIADNKRAALEKAVFSVVQGAVARKTFELSPDGSMKNVDTPPPDVPCVYAGYDALGQLLGVAFEGTAQGYGGMVKALFGYSPAKDTLIAFTLLESAETPGLGDRVQTDHAYLENWKALDVRLDPSGQALANPIICVKNGTKTQPWQVDAISGATITSKAVANAAAAACSQFAPAVKKNLTLLEGK